MEIQQEGRGSHVVADNKLDNDKWQSDIEPKEDKWKLVNVCNDSMIMWNFEKL